MPKYIPSETDKIIRAFLHSYEKGEVWKVHCGDKWLTVWLYSNSQIEHHKDLPLYEKMKQEYFELRKKYLDLNLSIADDITVYFESKENFETKYMSSWQLYYT
jgi:hypothetical protein